MEVMKSTNFNQLYDEVDEQLHPPATYVYFSYSRETKTRDYKPLETFQCNDKAEEICKPQITCKPSRLLLVWGCGEFGQHGHDINGDVTLEWSLTELNSGERMLNEESLVITAAGSSHTLALSESGKLYSWGNGTSGQLGNGTSQTAHKPTPVAMETNAKIRGMACGARHSFTWTADGQCYSFGNNFNAQLGYNFSKADFKENQLQPVLVELFPHVKVKEVACGARHTLFLLITGHVMAVGCNQHGQIGNDSTEDVVIPTKLDDLSDISHVACGNSHSLASDETGNLYACGYGKALGTKMRHVVSPKLFSPNRDANCTVVSLAGGDSHSMALYENGVLYTWGNNYEGQLGVGKSTKYQSEPEPIPNDVLPRPVVQISCGETTCAAVTGNGKLFMWGKNADLIHSEKSSQYFQFEPYHIETGNNLVTQVSCGAWHVATIIENTKLSKSAESQEIKTNMTEVEMEDLEYIQPDACLCKDLSNGTLLTRHSDTKNEMFTDNTTLLWEPSSADCEKEQRLVAENNKSTTILDTYTGCNNSNLNEKRPPNVKSTTSIQIRSRNGNFAEDKMTSEITKCNENVHSFDTTNTDKEGISNCDKEEEDSNIDKKVFSTFEFDKEGYISNFHKEDTCISNFNKEDTSNFDLEDTSHFDKEFSITDSLMREQNSEQIETEENSEAELKKTTDHSMVNLGVLNELKQPHLSCWRTNNQTRKGLYPGPYDFTQDTQNTTNSPEVNGLTPVLQKDSDFSVVPTVERKQYLRVSRKSSIPLSSNIVGPKPCFLRQQTMPVVNLSFRSSLEKISPSIKNEPKRRKPSFCSIQKMRNTSNLFREKQSKVLTDTKPGAGMDYVFNLERMLPNRPTHAVREVKKWTKFKDDSTLDVQRTKQVPSTGKICCNHSGELLPPICLCRKNNVFSRQEQTLPNVFIDRR